MKFSWGWETVEVSSKNSNNIFCFPKVIQKMGAPIWEGLIVMVFSTESEIQSIKDIRCTLNTTYLNAFKFCLNICNFSVNQKHKNHFNRLIYFLVRPVFFFYIIIFPPQAGTLHNSIWREQVLLGKGWFDYKGISQHLVLKRNISQHIL